MRILAHRGYWKTEREKNTLRSIQAALENGYGFESDIRDYCEKLVISHNVASACSPEAEKVMALLHEYQDKYCFAINIKADGLIDALKYLLKYYEISNYFTFDMSIPQMLEYKQSELCFFTRKSEFEPEPVMYSDAAGIWVDAFEDDSWITGNLLKKYLDDGKKICIVSPDLHGKSNHTFWNRLKNFKIGFENVYLCTDHPDEAKIFFEKELDEINDKSSNF